MAQAPIVNVLFVSRRNTVRSVLAEALLSALSKGRFRAFSCGSPKYLGGVFHPMALQTLLKAALLPPAGSCKSWDVFNRGSHRMDFVITLSAGVEGEAPSWLGQPRTALWPCPDILDDGDFGASVQDGMAQTLYSLKRRMDLFTSLPMRANCGDLSGDVRDIGYLP